MLHTSVRWPVAVGSFVAAILATPASADPPWFSPWGRFAPTGSSSPPLGALTDLNGDGNTDVVVGKGKELLVGLGDGAGRFTMTNVPLTLLIPEFSTTPIIGKFDDDAFPDAMLYDDLGIKGRMFFGDGTGGFNFGFDTPVWSNAVEAKAVDIDADGRTELFHMNMSSKAGLFRLTSTGWITPVTLPNLSGTVRVLTDGDFDGDGDVDLLVGTDGVGLAALRILTGNGGTAFTLGPASALFMTFGAGSRMRTSDVDSDGDLDVVFSVASTLWIARNTGSGAFVPDAHPVATTSSWDLADVDGDDDEDLVLADAERLETRLNNGSGSFIAVLDTYTVPVDLLGLFVSRLDGDAAPDLVMASSQGQPATSQMLLVSARGRGDGSWGLPSWTTPQAVGPHTIGVADFDGDGDGDVVQTGVGFVSTYTNDGAGRFVANATQSTSASGAIQFADLDQDGLVEALLVGQVGDVATAFGIEVFDNVHGALLGSTFVNATNPSIVANGVDCTTGDFDGDGDVDAFVVAQSVATGSVPAGATTLRGLVNQGGTLTLPAGTPPSWPLLDASLEHIRSGDVDNDGDLDLFVGNRQVVGPKNDVVLLLGDGQGGFAQGPIVPIDVSALDRSLQVLDVDGDGFIDVLGSADSVSTTVLYGISGGAFAAPATLGAPGQSRDMRFADFDDDGHVDVASVSSTGSVRVSRQSAPRSFVFDGVVPLGSELADLVATDANGDGRADLVATRASAPHPVLLPRACDGGVASTVNACPGSGGIVPVLSVQRCPLAGHTIEFAIDDALGGTRGFLLISTGVTPIPFKTGCALDLNIPMTRLATFATSGFGPGNGEASIAYSLPLALAGTTFAAQAVLRDPASPNQAVVTNAVVVDVE